MQDKPGKCIVDSQGNAFKKDKNIKQFLTDSTKNILTVLLTSGIAGVVMEIFKEEVIYDYANSCASFYGVDKRYFSGIEMVEDKLVYIIALLVVVVGLAVWFLLPCGKKKTNGKAEAIIMFITIVSVLSSVNMLCILCIVSFAHWDWMRHWADQYAWGLMLLISSVILAYFFRDEYQRFSVPQHLTVEMHLQNRRLHLPKSLWLLKSSCEYHIYPLQF